MKRFFSLFQHHNNDKGFSLVENLVAITVLALSTAATAPIITSSMHASISSRSQAALFFEVSEIFNEFRSQNLNDTLALINSNISAVGNEDATQFYRESTTTNATFRITIIAVSNANMGIPEAVILMVEVINWDAHLGDTQRVFQTLITQVA